MSPITLLARLAIAVVIAAGVSAAQSPSLSEVRTVYFWPMSASLDQYLAEQLSTDTRLQVVVDPKLANAIFTERIDAPFLKAMDELFPTGPSTDDPEEDTSSGSIESGTSLQRPANRALGRPQGTVFLVHVPSRKVLWSTFVNRKDSRPGRLHRTAGDVIGRLKKVMAAE